VASCTATNVASTFGWEEGGKQVSTDSLAPGWQGPQDSDLQLSHPRQYHLFMPIDWPPGRHGFRPEDEALIAAPPGRDGGRRKASRSSSRRWQRHSRAMTGGLGRPKNGSGWRRTQKNLGRASNFYRCQMVGGRSKALGGPVGVCRCFVDRIVTHPRRHRPPCRPFDPRRRHSCCRQGFLPPW
jgi:hypothetical protein